MSKIAELKEQRAGLISEIDRISEIAEPTSEDVTSMKDTNDKIKSIDSQIQIIEENQKRKAAQATSVAFEAKSPEVSKSEEKDLSKFSFLKFLREGSPENRGGLTGLEKEMHEEAKKEYTESGETLKGIGIPGMILKRTSLDGVETRDLSAGVNTEGGFTVPTFKNGFIDNLRDSLALRQLGAQFLSGLTGDIEIPKKNASASFAWAAENATATETNITFLQVPMAPNRLTGFLDISKQLVLQSSRDVERMVIEDITLGAALAFDKAGLDGSGTGSEPEGILQTTGIGAVTTTGIANLNWAKVVEFETTTNTNNALEGNLGYVFGAATRGHLKTTAKDAGSGIFLMGEGNQLNGYNTVVTNQMATTDMIFGNFRDLIMGQWGGLDIIIDPYTLAKNNQLQITLHMLGDVAVRHAESFTAATDL